MSSTEKAGTGLRILRRLAHHAYESGEQSHVQVGEANARLHAAGASITSLEAHVDELVHALAILPATAGLNRA